MGVIKSFLRGGEDKEENPQKKSYLITSVQSIQTPQHADHYTKDSSRGAPNEALIKNFDEHAQREDAQSIILQMPGMGRTEQQLHKFFEGREDLITPIENFERLKRDLDREKIRIKRLEERAEKKGCRVDQLGYVDYDYISRGTDYLEKGKILTDSGIPLNTKITIANVNYPPQNKNPWRGAQDAVQHHLEKTIIMASPKQTIVPFAKNLSSKLPRLEVSPGACTLPNYNSQDSRGKSANWNHQYGFSRVDIINSNLYLVRLIPALKNGTFFDLGMKYEPDKKPKKAKVLAFVPGDIHYGEHDEGALEASLRIHEELKPENCMLHDFFSFYSINPHESENLIKEEQDYAMGRTNLEKEVALGSAYLKKYAKNFPKTDFWIIDSNHHDFLHRYLMGDKYIKDKENRAFGRRIATLFGESNDMPVEAAMKYVLGGKMPKNIHFLKRGQDFRLGGTQLSAHGHKGPNGARGSFPSLKTAYGRILFGHTHMIRQEGNALTCGTLAKIPMEYQLGQPATSIHGAGILYEGGLIQAIPIINGIYKAE